MLLVDMIKEEVAPNSRSFHRDTVTAEKKVAMTFHYLKDQGSFRQTEYFWCFQSNIIYYVASCS